MMMNSFQLHVVTKNVQSIRSDARLEDLVLELKELDFDFLFLTETWRDNAEEMLEVDGGTKNVPQRWRPTSRSGDCCFEAMLGINAGRCVSCLFSACLFFERFGWPTKSLSHVLVTCPHRGTQMRRSWKCTNFWI